LQVRHQVVGSLVEIETKPVIVQSALSELIQLCDRQQCHIPPILAGGQPGIADRPVRGDRAAREP